RAESEGMNTIPDPRSPSPASVYSRSSSHSPASAEHHPDLSNEVAALSTKLINAINHQTTLDDALQETRHELDAARERIAQLEKAAREHSELISQGLLVKKEEVDRKEGRWRNDLNQEIQKREIAERDKRRMEGELENLTANLFEEANTMVSNARKETESSNHRISQLQNQLRDTETLLSSQQEQLQGLKEVMQSMSDRDENEIATHMSSAPSTPGLKSSSTMRSMFDAANLTPVTPGFGDEIPPQHPLFFTQLLTPVLRSDLPAFEDFQTLLRTSKNVPTTTSRVNSGTFSGLNAMSIGLGSGHLSHAYSRSSPAAPTPPDTPNMSASAGSAGSPRDSLNLNAPQLPPLKESKYFKRCLPEDIEPTLRLDIAPGLSWLAKRSVLQSIVTGSLAIEPLAPAASKNYGPIYACSLCGENRKNAAYQRRHQFRIQEDDPDAVASGGAKAKAQRWPLCEWCLGRIRSVCDFVGFLRMCQAGVWRADVPEKEREAWEEGVRLREKMFWCRVGGGVIPSFVTKSPTMEDSRRESDESDESARKSLKGKEEDPFKTKGESEKRVSIGKTII
ncbi:Sec2p-domain-containing protein, partial [Rhizodiscina lignyota]